MTKAALRAERFDGLSPDRLATMWGVPRVDAWRRIESTNDRAVVLARAGAPRGTVVVADEQLAGRGRHGGRWLSASGAGLWMSIVLDESDAFPQVTLLAGVATAEAVEAEVPGASVTIRWPNDLMLAGGKVGGILAEVVSGRLVVGIGVNLTPPKGGFPVLRTPPATLDQATTANVSRSALAGRVIGQVHSKLERAHPDRDAIQALVGRDALLGRAVDTEQHGEGVARGIDQRGLLVLERPDGNRVHITAGRVTPTEPPGVEGAMQTDSSNSSFGR